MSLEQDQYAEIVNGTLQSPFSVLGPQQEPNGWRITCFYPGARAISLVDGQKDTTHPMRQVHVDGVFMLTGNGQVPDYSLRIDNGTRTWQQQDPYRFPSALGDMDHYLFCEATHADLYTKLGANLIELEGVAGVHFGVWAPNAHRVSVVGPFNRWDGRVHVMRRHPGSGLWDLFVPGLKVGELYKFELLDARGRVLPLKSDPFARAMEPAPGNASIVYQDDFEWQSPRAAQQQRCTFNRPMSIYEVHLGSWRRNGHDYKSYEELAMELVEYVSGQGFTHIELLPIHEHPFDGSWGYQPIGLFAPTSRYGSPRDFKYFVDCCHQSGLGVILDWVPAHFPKDDHGLRRFDGTCLYEHEDPRQGEHKDWGTLIFNYGRNEVQSYLLSNASYWIREFHVDALRVDAVASMLYLDYSRDDGEWIPNREGGNENLEAIAFLREMNRLVHALGAITMAEESTSWPGVTRPVDSGGLGFSYKWNMGWMHDSLDYMGEQPVHRTYHHDKLTFGLMYAFSENFILPLSHDEVVHGKKSLIGRMPGDTWQRFANLRAYYSYLYTQPGKKLLFMGGEFGQEREWRYQGELDWNLLDLPTHAGLQNLVRDLNVLYTSRSMLYEGDCDSTGFQWINHSERHRNVVSYRRLDQQGRFIVVLINFSLEVYPNYRIGVPAGEGYVEVLNSDHSEYGGSGVINAGVIQSDTVKYDDLDHSIVVQVPPMAGLILEPISTSPQSGP